VELAPAAQRTITITLHADQTAYTGRDGRRRLDPGAVELWIGASSADIRCRLAFTMVGASRMVGADRVLWARVDVDPPA
jgi:beta-glucosidase